MTDFFAELKRRQMYRVAAAYAVVAWILLQLINNLTPALKLPDWASTFVVILLTVGFPVALLFCWIQHLPPTDSTAPAPKTGRTDWVLIGALAVVLLFMGYQQIADAPRQTAVDATLEAAALPRSGISLVVLPFANLSGDTSQEFFSDGMTEEITSALARVPNLRVVGRTSAFQFKGENKDLRAIGQALAATHLIEGSVRREGNQLRITAQLIKADDGTNIWTESYNRQLTGVFAVQEEIAQAIAASLRVPLKLGQGERLVSSRANDPATYQQYLRARAMVRARGRSLTEGTTLLEQVTTSDRDYAPAWALLALAYSVSAARPNDVRYATEVLLPRGEAAAKLAIELDPNLADGYVSLGRIQAQRGQLLAAEDLYARALALDPNNPDALSIYANLRGSAGRLKDALAMRQQAIALEPFVPVYRGNLAEDLWLNGQNEAAIETLRAMSQTGVDLARIYASLGRYTDAADALADNLTPESTIAAQLLRTAPARSASPETIPELGILGFVYLHVGAPDRVLAYYEATVQRRILIAAENALLWHQSYAPVRKLERFKTFVRSAGLVEYWRVHGWPESCRPMGADDFQCG